MLRQIYEKGFFHLLSANFLTQGLGFVSSLLVAKFLSPVEFGEIRLMQSYTTLFMVLATCGLNTVVLKLCSESRSEEDKANILRFALGRSLLTSSLALIVLAALSWTGVVTSSPHLSRWLPVYALVIPFAVVTDIFVNFLQAQKRVQDLARALTFVKGQLFVLVVFSAWLWGFTGFVWSAIAAYAIGLLPLVRQVTLRFLSAASRPVPSFVFQLAFFSVLANAVSMLGQYGDIFILDHFSRSRAEIGYYALATTLLLGATQVTATAQSIMTPYFSERAHDAIWLRRQIIKNQIRLTVLSVAVAFAAYAAAVVLVSVVYGATYQSTLTYLAILLLKYVVWSSYAVMTAALLGLGLVRYNFAAVAVSTPVGLCLSYMLLQRLGVTGVAWAQVGAALVNFALAWWLSRLALQRMENGEWRMENGNGKT